MYIEGIFTYIGVDNWLKLHMHSLLSFFFFFFVVDNVNIM